MGVAEVIRAVEIFGTGTATYEIEIATVIATFEIFGMDHRPFAEISTGTETGAAVTATSIPGNRVSALAVAARAPRRLPATFAI